jgi:hypothetical protein
MKYLFKLLLISLFPLFAMGQSTETEIQEKIDAVRTRPLSPTSVANSLELLNKGKQSILNNFIASGTDTYLVNANIGITEYEVGQVVFITFTNANTGGSVTLNINSLGAINIKNNNGANLLAGDIAAGGAYALRFNGTEFRTMGAVSNNVVWGIISGTISNQTDLQTALDAKANEALTFNTQTGSTYTLVLTDKDTKSVLMRSASAQILTVPNNSDVAFPLGTIIPVVQDSSGVLTLSPAGGVAFESSTGTFGVLRDMPTYLIKKSTNTWIVANSGGGGGGGVWGGITGILSSQTDLQTALNDRANVKFAYNIQTGSAYTLVLTDKDTKAVLMRSASAQTLTVPLQSSVNFPIGSTITVVQDSTGITTVSPAVGVQFENNTGVFTSVKDAPLVLVKKATNVWYVFNGTTGGGGGGGDAEWGAISGILSDQADLQAALDTKANEFYSFNIQTGTGYTLQLSDKDTKAVLMRRASAQVLTVPTNASVPYPIGTTITIVRDSTGTLTVTPASGVGLENATGVFTVPQDAPAVLVKKATNTWLLFNGTDGSGGGGGTWGSIVGNLPDQIDLQTALDDKADEKYNINVQTGASYTLIISDKDTKAVLMRRATAQTLVVPTNSSVPFPIGTVISAFQDSTGTVTISGGVGVQFENNSGLYTTIQDAPVVLIKKATNTWIICNGTPGGFPNPLPADMVWNAAGFDFAFNSLATYEINAATSLKHSLTSYDTKIILDNNGVDIQANEVADRIRLKSTNDIDIDGGTLKLKGIAAPGANYLVGGDLTWKAPGGGGGGSGTVTSITATSPLTGGTITGSGSIGIVNAAADGTTKGAAGFNANSFNSTLGIIDIDYDNAQKASSTLPGLVSIGAQVFPGLKTFSVAPAITGLTQGSVLFYGPSSIAQDNANFKWDDTLNKLNIGAPTITTGSLNVALNGAAANVPLTISNSSLVDGASSSLGVVAGSQAGYFTQFTLADGSKPGGTVIHGAGTGTWGLELSQSNGNPVRLSSGGNQWVTVTTAGVGINKQTGFGANFTVRGSGTNNVNFLAESSTGARMLEMGTVGGNRYTKLDLGSDATGDVYYRNASGNLARLGVGTNGQVLTLASGVPSWATVSGTGITDGDKVDITVTGTNTWTIDANAVSLAKMQDFTTARLLGRITAGTGDPEQLTGTQVTSMLDAATTSLKGLVPAPGTATGKVLTDNMTWQTVSGGGGSGTVTSIGMAVGTAGTAPNVSGSPVTTNGTITLNIPNASATATGSVTTGAQTIAGAKTFTTAPLFSTMTAGSVLFAGTSGMLSQDNTNFRWDNTNKRFTVGPTLATPHQIATNRNVNDAIDNIIISNTNTGASATARLGMYSGSVTGVLQAKHSTNSFGIYTDVNLTSVTGGNSFVNDFYYGAQLSQRFSYYGTYFSNYGGTATTPTAKVHIGAGSTGAGTAPLKFTAGTAMTTPENGAMEYHNNHLYVTIGSTRYQLDQQSIAGTYTPTATNVSATSALTGYTSQWSRIGNVITVSGYVSYTGAVSAGFAVLDITLPVAMNVVPSDATFAAGTASGVSGAEILAGQVSAASQTTARIRVEAPAVAGLVTLTYTLTYRLQ